MMTVDISKVSILILTDILHYLICHKWHLMYSLFALFSTDQWYACISRLAARRVDKMLVFSCLLKWKTTTCILCWIWEGNLKIPNYLTTLLDWRECGELEWNCTDVVTCREVAVSQYGYENKYWLIYGNFLELIFSWSVLILMISGSLSPRHCAS